MCSKVCQLLSEKTRLWPPVPKISSPHSVDEPSLRSFALPGLKTLASIAPSPAAKSVFGPRGWSLEKLESVITTLESIKTVEEAMAVKAEMFGYEEELLLWRKEVARQELQDSYQPCTEELEWFKCISRFYLVFVPFLKLSISSQGKRCKVFVSYSGSTELPYATPLKNYLEKNGVDHVFHATKELRVGQHVEEEILLASLSCHHFWCVFTESFIAGPGIWPLREFFIGCARHVLEKESDFCLLVDCVEMNRTPTGLWLENFLSFKSLFIFDQEGTKQTPAQMQRAFPSESFDDRIERIASMKVSGKPPLVRNTSTHDWALQKAEMFGPESLFLDSFKIDLFKEELLKGDTIRLLNTWIANIEELVEPLTNAVRRGAKLHVLLLKPDSPLADARNKALEHGDKPFRREQVKEGIKRSVACIRDIRNLGMARPGQVDLRFYDSLASFSIYQVDQKAFVGFYFHGRVGIALPQILTLTTSKFGEEIKREFEELWFREETVDLDSW